MAGRHFKADTRKALEDLSSTLARMRGTARIDFGGHIWKYEAEAMRQNGITFTDRATGLREAGVRITIFRQGKGYAIEADEFPHREDNLRAVQQFISSQYRGLEVYKVRRVGVDSFDALFGGFMLLDDGKREWWQIIGVPQDATKRQVTKAFREKAHEAHPDKGGSEEQFSSLKQAYEHAMELFDKGR